MADQEPCLRCDGEGYVWDDRWSFKCPVCRGTGQRVYANGTPSDLLDIHDLGGKCPVQAEGRVRGLPFYFRARGSHWTFEVCRDEDAEDGANESTLFFFQGQYSGLHHEAGYIEEGIAASIIRTCAESVDRLLPGLVADTIAVWFATLLASPWPPCTHCGKPYHAHLSLKTWARTRPDEDPAGEPQCRHCVAFFGETPGWDWAWCRRDEHADPEAP